MAVLGQKPMAIDSVASPMRWPAGALIVRIEAIMRTDISPETRGSPVASRRSRALPECCGLEASATPIATAISGFLAAQGGNTCSVATLPSLSADSRLQAVVRNARNAPGAPAA
jgi:hypothetical protein